MDRIADIWGERTPYAADEDWPDRVDLFLEPGFTDADVTWHQSACVLCSNGCGMDIAVADGRMVGVRGRAEDRVSHGRLGPKGLYASTTWANAADRLTRPLVRQGGGLVETGWEHAMGRVVEKSQSAVAIARRIIETHVDK